MALDWCNSSLWPLWGASGRCRQALHRGGVVGQQEWNKLEGGKKGGNKVTKDLGKDFFFVKRVKQWNRAQGNYAASIPVFKTQLDKALNNPGCTFAWPCFLKEFGLETSYDQIHQKTTKLFLSHFKNMTKNNRLLWKMRDWQISLP